MAADPMPTTLDALPAWIARHFAPNLRASVYNRLAPRIRAAETGAVAQAAPSQAGGASPPPSSGAPGPSIPVASPTQQAGLDYIDQQLAAVPIRGNAGRRALFAEGGRSLTDNGLFDTAQVDVGDRAADGSISYRIITGPDGQRYRQAYQDNAAGFNARGSYFSSGRRNADIDARRSLNNQRDSFLRDLAARQTDSINADADQVSGLVADRAQLRGQIAEDAAAAPVAPVSDPVSALGGAQGAPRELPNVVRNPGAGSIAGLRRRGYTRRGTSNVWIRS